jgi:hypothetical protein
MCKVLHTEKKGKTVITLTHDKVDNFVEKQVRLGNDVRWDGWDMIFFSPSPKGSYIPNGVHREFPSILTGGEFRNGEWGYKTTVTPGSDGKWRVPNRNAKHLRRPGPR